MAQKRPEDAISTDEPSLSIREVREGSPTKKLKLDATPVAEAVPDVVEDEGAAVSPCPDKPSPTVESTAAESTTTRKWDPPVYGSPTWLEIPTTDIAAAKTFYNTIFNWTFQSHPTHDGNQFQMFSVPDPRLQTCLGGGLVKVNKKTSDAENVGPTVVVYLIVDDVDEAFEKIKAAGGEVLPPGKIAEGTCGWMGKFKDLDGNVFGVYEIIKQGENVTKEEEVEKEQEEEVEKEQEEEVEKEQEKEEKMEVEAEAVEKKVEGEGEGEKEQVEEKE